MMILASDNSIVNSIYNDWKQYNMLFSHIFPSRILDYTIVFKVVSCLCSFEGLSILYYWQLTRPLLSVPIINIINNNIKYCIKRICLYFNEVFTYKVWHNYSVSSVKTKNNYLQNTNKHTSNLQISIITSLIYKH